MMNHRALALLALGAWLGCKNATLTHIEIEERAETLVEGATLLETLVGDLGFEGFVSMDVTEAQKLKNQGVEPGDIKDVRLVAFQLTASGHDAADLAFIDRMEVWVEAPDLDPVLLAWQDSFPEGQPEVDMEIEDVDLTDFAVSESMTFTTDVTARRPQEDTLVTADVIIDVGVTVQGACNQAKKD